MKPIDAVLASEIALDLHHLLAPRLTLAVDRESEQVHQLVALVLLAEKRMQDSGMAWDQKAQVIRAANHILKTGRAAAIGAVGSPMAAGAVDARLESQLVGGDAVDVALDEITESGADEPAPKKRKR